VVDPVLTLTGLTSAFTLAGVPATKVVGTATVAYNVETNNLAGYSVSVTSSHCRVTATLTGKSDVIPIGDLSASDSGLGTFAPLSADRVRISLRSAPCRCRCRGHGRQGGDGVGGRIVVRPRWVPRGDRWDGPRPPGARG